MKRFLSFVFVLCLIVSSIGAVSVSAESDIHPIKLSSSFVVSNPVKVSFSSSDASGIHVKWSAVAASGLPSSASIRYALFVYRDDIEEWSRVAFTDKLSYVYKPKYPGTYKFVVQVTDAAYETAVTGLSDSATMVWQTPPEFVTSITADGVKFVWKPLADVSKYRIYYKDDNGVWQKIGATSDTSFVTSEIPYGTRNVTVRGMNSEGTLFYTDFIRGRELTYLPNPVFDSVELTLGSNDIHFSWKAVKGSPKYAIYEKTENGWERIGCTADTQFDYHLNTVGSYKFSIRCVSDDESTFLSFYDVQGYEVTMPEYITIGDVDGDGSLTVVDVTVLQRYIVGLSVPSFNKIAADVDRDGDVTIVDAALIQRHLIGMFTPFDFGFIVL